jgi:hypothetical protein
VADSDGITRRNGLKVDAAKQAAWQRRGAIRYAAKQRARKGAARHTSKIDRRPSAANDWPPLVRKLARRRSGGVCEICLTEAATHLHHRKLRRHGDHRIVNALHLCAKCHQDVHRGDQRIAAYDAGYLVRSHHDPADVPVVLNDERMLLTADGDYELAA